MLHRDSVRRIVSSILAQHPEVRMDAAETAVLERSLLYVKRELLRTEFGPLKAFDLIPLAEDTPADAEQISYPLLTDFGVARIIANYADDLPLVDVAMEEFFAPIFDVGVGYLWAIQDMRRASRAGEAGVNILVEKPRAARDAIARKFDEIAAIGVPEANVGGFVNHPNVPIVTLTNGDWLNPATTPAEILADLLEWEESVITATRENHYANTVVLPGAYLRRIHEPRSTTSDRTIWEQFVESSQLVQQDRGEWTLERWSYLDSVEGDPRGVMYKRDPGVLQLEAPLLYEERPPQEVNMSMKVPAYGRVGGTVFKKPLAASYATNIGAP